MNTKRNLLSLFILANLSGCAEVPIIDSEWVGDIGEDGGVAFHTLTDESRDIPKADWDLERFGMLCTKSETFADWKGVIEKLCRSTYRCKEQNIQTLNDFFERVMSFNAKADGLKR